MFARFQAGLTAGVDACASWAARQQPWGSVYGLARSVLGLGTLLTLVVNDTSTLFRPAVGLEIVPRCEGWLTTGTLWCMTGGDGLELGRWISILVLVLVVVGWRPRWTGVLHWYVAWSLNTSALLLDGGDQVAAVLSALLLPITLTDGRRWHWDRMVPLDGSSAPGLYSRWFAGTAAFMIRLQVFGIYFHAAIAKFSVEEWANGTAAYYWFLDPMLGLAPWLRTLAMPMLTSPVGVVALTWLPLALEIVLFAAILLPRRRLGWLLVLGLAFHWAIAISIGLISFALSMSAALILYLRELDRPFLFVEMGWDAARRRLRGQFFVEL